MYITKILTISGCAIVLSGCLSTTQTQIEGTGPAVDATGPAHIHNVEGTGDVTHQHKGNSTESHSHSWDEIQKELNKP